MGARRWPQRFQVFNVRRRRCSRWGPGPQVSEDQGRARLSPDLCEWRRGFPARIEERAQEAGDVTVCGGDCLRGPRFPQAPWPCPSPRPARPWRGRFSTQVRSEGCHLGPRPPTPFPGRLLGPPFALYRSTYQTFVDSFF